MLRTLILLLVAAVFVSPAWADGRVFVRVNPEAVVIPDQQALIHFADGVQTLVIETRFEPAPSPTAAPDDDDQEGPRYAWVVPLPAAGGTPEVFPVTTGLFPTLRSIFLPRIVSRGPSEVIGATILLIALMMAVAPRGPRGSWAVVAIISSLLVCIALPALGRARSITTHAPADAVLVLDRRVVGSYDVAIIAARDGADAGTALVSWLGDHGFPLPPGVEPVLAEYAVQGWCFAAARLGDTAGTSAGEPAEPLTPHPLGFRFRTPEPVYPLKLTGVGNGPLRVDLYVFGGGTAAAEGFQTVRSAPVYTSPDPPAHFQPPEGTVIVAHHGLRELVGTAAHATKLTATLTPEQMRDDLTLRWTPARDVGGVWYTDSVRAGHAMVWPGLAFFGGVVLVLALFAITRGPRTAASNWALALSLPTAAATVAIYFALPGPQIELIEGKGRGPGESYASRVAQDANAKLAAHPPEAWGLPLVRRLLATEFERHAEEYADSKFARLYAVREEDSPGNYTLTEEADGTIMMWWHDERAQPRWGMWFRPPHRSGGP